MKTGTTTHPKFRRLQKKLKLPTYAVAGLLEMIWMLTIQFAAEDGDLTRFSAQEIADYCDYEGDADSLVDALVEARWLDRDADSLRVHDWVDHRPSFIEDRIRIRESRRKPNDSEGCSETVRSSSRTFANNRPLPSQAKPSQTNSNQAKPSQAQPVSAEGGGVAGLADLSFLALASDRIPDVARQAKAIDKNFPKQFPELDEVFKFAWVCLATREGFVPEIIEKFKRLQQSPKPVRSPRNWLFGSLRRELEPMGVSLEDALAKAPPWSQIKQKSDSA